MLVRFGAPHVSDDELMGMPWMCRSSDCENDGLLASVGADKTSPGNLHVGVSQLDCVAAE